MLNVYAYIFENSFVEKILVIFLKVVLFLCLVFVLFCFLVFVCVVSFGFGADSEFIIHIKD